MFKMNQTPLVIFLVAIVLTLNGNADFWSSSVEANSSHWSIFRQSSNFSFNLSSLVEGKISPVESRGRILSPYQAYYAEVGSNDVRLGQRTSALQGSYTSSDEITMQSIVYPDKIEITVDKPAGTDLYTIEYKDEKWPVFMKTSRTLSYSGQQINDRDFEGNNGDFVSASFLYNRELSKEQRSIIWLQRMNATVLATNDTIQSAEFKPTKYLGYLIEASTTGIADLGYRLRESQYDVKHQSYPVQSEGEERYFGTYYLSRKIEMRSVFDKINDTDDADYVADTWLPCCYGDWNEMMHFDKKGLGNDAKGIFDCTCYKETTKT
jgi:hypothetical protein